MAEELVMTKETTPKKVAFASKPYSKEDKRKKEEDELKELLEEQKKDVEEVTKPETSTDGEPEPDNAEERSFKKRYGDLRRHSQKQTEDFKKEIDSLKNQLDSATRKEITLPKSDEDIEAWTKQYPDVAAIVETIATKKAMEQSKNLEERMKTIDEMQFNVTKEKAENELLRIHPDFGEIRDSDEFHEWAEEQPKWVQDSRSKPVENESKSYLKESTVEKMSAQEYEKKSDDIMEAIRSGKFIYDISGSAR